MTLWHRRTKAQHSTTFYPTKCPINETPKYSSEARRGFFGDLNLHHGIAFDPAGTNTADLVTSEEANSLFLWPNEHIENLKKCQFPCVVDGNSREGRLHMVSYLFELGCHLCLSPLVNVSTAPGFEGPLGWRGYKE